VESIPQKLEQNRPTSCFIFLLLQQFGHRVCGFGHRFFTRQKSPKTGQIRPPNRAIRPPNLTDSGCIIF